jgi:adenylate cyclase
VTVFLDGVKTAVHQITTTPFAKRTGAGVPVTTGVGYDQAVELDATWLYTDLMDSSGLVALCPVETVGKTIRLFLDVAVRVMEFNGGEIRSFDGDRVMSIFHGDGRQDAAVRAAMQIKWSCDTLLQPALASKYKSLREGGWRVRPASGVASGKTLIVRGGVRRKDNDLVSIGVAPNLAAKLSDQRHDTHLRHLRVDAATYSALSQDSKVASDGKGMWSEQHGLVMGGVKRPYRYTKYHRTIG